MTPLEEQQAMQDYVRQQVAGGPGTGDAYQGRDYRWFLDNPPPDDLPLPQHREYLRRMREEFDREMQGSNERIQRSLQGQQQPQLPSEPLIRPGTVPMTPGTLPDEPVPSIKRQFDPYWGPSGA